MPAFLDYALAEARSTRFDVQTLGGLKQYIPSYLATRERRATARAQEIARRAAERDDALRIEYDNYRRREASRILAGLPKVARAAIENNARPHVASFSGPLRVQMLELRKQMLTAQRYGNRIKSFEDWKVTRHTK